jgi:hypothetical protein
VSVPYNDTLSSSQRCWILDSDYSVHHVVVSVLLYWVHLKMSHEHCYMCFDLNARNPVTDAMQHMQAGKRHWINSTIAQVFVDLPYRVPAARSERHMLTVSCYPGPGSWRSDRSATFCISRLFSVVHVPVNEGKQENVSRVFQHILSNIVPRKIL